MESGDAIVINAIKQDKRKGWIRDKEKNIYAPVMIKNRPEVKAFEFDQALKAATHPYMGNSTVNNEKYFCYLTELKTGECNFVAINLKSKEVEFVHKIQIVNAYALTICILWTNSKCICIYYLSTKYK